MSGMRARAASAAALAAVVATAGMLAGGSAQAVVGSAAPEAAYGFTAKLDIGEGEQRRSCSGTLVDAQWVLTAAACFAEVPNAGTGVTPGKPQWKTTATIGRGASGHVTEVVELVPRDDRDLVMARLSQPATGMTPLALATTPAVSGETLQGTGFGRTKTEWVPDAAHSASFKVGDVAGADVALVGASADDSLCKGDTGAPLVRQNQDGRTELVGVASRSWQGGCFGESETRTGAIAARTDDLAEWVRATVEKVWARQLHLADFNGDGKADAMTVDAIDGGLYVQAGDGAGRFGPRYKAGSGWYTMRLLAAADFTGDKKADVLAVQTSGKLFVYPSDGAGGFGAAIEAGSGWSDMRLLTAGDFTADGKADVLAVHKDGKLFLYPGDGKGRFSAPSQAGSGWGEMRLIAAADFTGDKKSDVLAVHSGGKLFVYPGSGVGGFGSAIEAGSGWNNMSLIAAADVTGDGRSDILAMSNRGKLFVYPGNGKGGFNPPIDSGA